MTFLLFLFPTCKVKHFCRNLIHLQSVGASAVRPSGGQGETVPGNSSNG